MPKRTTITIPDDLVDACTKWQDEQWTLLRHRTAVTNALIALARVGAIAEKLIDPNAPLPTQRPGRCGNGEPAGDWPAQQREWDPLARSRGESR